jgi:hypothetical protein
MTSISSAIAAVGGPVKAAELCGIKRQAIDKWLARSALPRTEYTGETRYAELLAQASAGTFTAESLLAGARPIKSAA